MAKHRISTSGLLNYIRDQCFNDWDVEPGRNSSMTSTICRGSERSYGIFLLRYHSHRYGDKTVAGRVALVFGAEFSSHGRGSSAGFVSWYPRVSLTVTREI